MDSVGNAFLYTMNWNPAYSYSTLPAGYNYDSIPAHWKVMLQKVDPAEKGVPHFKDIFVSDVKVNYAKKAISASGYEKSILRNFNFENVHVDAATAGEINYAESWNMKKVSIRAMDKSKVSVKNSTGINF
jgi:hypothetical protein